MNNAEARLEILTRINRAIFGLQAAPLPPYPVGPQLNREEVLRQFEDRTLDYRAVFHRVPATEVGRVVTAALAGTARVVLPDGLPRAWHPDGVTVLRDDPPLTHLQLDMVDAVVTGCVLAISETGTILLDHGPCRDRHVCVIWTEQVVQGRP